MKKDKINLIRELAEPIVQQEDLFLVDVEVKGANETVLWIYVDSEQGDVSIESCSRISQELGFVLDAHEAMTTKYRLNISSPGLSRPLSDRRQYFKNRGRTARVKYKTPEGYKKLEGTLRDITGETIELEVDKKHKERIELSDIVETKIIPNI